MKHYATALLLVTALAAQATLPPRADAASAMPMIDAAKVPATGPVPAFTSARVHPDDTVPPPNDIGAFRTVCTMSHMSFDDPIVFPGAPGASHLHMFWGNDGVNAASTVRSVADTGGSTCAGGTLNRTGYWAPAMVDTATHAPVTPSGILVYYKTGYLGVKPADVKPVPAGLRMIAGSARASAPYPDKWNYTTRYGCGDSWQPSIPSCKPGQTMTMEVQFPQCWDGVNLDSPDHQSHMAFAKGGCGGDHPVALPLISYEISYPVGAEGSANWRLSSDNYDGQAGYSGHGDYYMGWDAETMKALVTNCDNKSVDCHAYYLGNGMALY